MVQAPHDEFFDAPVLAQFEDVADSGKYRPLPDGWMLAIADIVDSTGAIDIGRYKDVNMAGASVISAILNALDRHDLPFTFGGDGALVAIPRSGIDAATAALAAVRRWVDEELELTMRTALVPVTAIRAAGQDVRVATLQASANAAYAMFSGGGTSWAEAQMKAGLYAVAEAEAGSRPDLTGLSCRWNPIQSRHGEIASVIAMPGPMGNGPAFRQLISEIVALASTEDRNGHPVPVDGPELGLSLAGLEKEARATAAPSGRLRRKLEIFGQYLLTVSLFKLGWKLGSFDAKVYKRDVAENTDFRKFDDGLKMTIDVDAERLEKITARLEEAAQAGICRYGLHRQGAALMTCIVPTPLSRDHMHFVDGATGGYAAASKRLKEKAALETSAATPLTP